MTAPALSLVMCTLGRTDCLSRLFHSLLAQDCADFELIVVDQNPPGLLDPLLAPLRGRIALVHLRSRPGLSIARNVGIAAARGQLLAFPDDDCWYPPGLVREVLRRFEGLPELAALTCRTRDQHGRDSNGSFLQQSAAISRSNVWQSGNSNGLFVRARAARQIGGFNEALGVGSGTPFGSGEESDFLLRLLAHGGTARYCHDMHTHHDQVDAVLDERALRRAGLYARGFGRTLRLNGYPVAFALMRALRSTTAAALALLMLSPRRARFKCIWALGILAGYRVPP